VDTSCVDRRIKQKHRLATRKKCCKRHQRRPQNRYTQKRHKINHKRPTSQTHNTEAMTLNRHRIRRRHPRGPQNRYTQKRHKINRKRPTSQTHNTEAMTLNRHHIRRRHPRGPQNRHTTNQKRPTQTYEKEESIRRDTTKRHQSRPHKLLLLLLFFFHIEATPPKDIKADHIIRNRLEKRRVF